MRRCATTLEPEMTDEEHKFLGAILREEHGAGFHLEIGTAAGGTLCAMLNLFTSNQRPRFVVVDTMKYFPDQLAVIWKNLKQHGFDPNQIEFRVSRSDEAFTHAEAANESFDFVLIDGSHKVRAVMSDLKWTRLVNVGGLICLHDYSRRFPGVKLTVDYFLRRNSNYERIGLVGSLLALRKTRASARSEISRLDEGYALALHLPLKLHAMWIKGRLNL